ncbi:MAG: tyrosine-type recombinase/integrase [Anaerolineaceae bacterium]|nr:tyrosine-type recombinase/integrase [Anaerolineaceae bacterium]
MARRRSNNEGSIYQRKDGRWVAQLSVDGKRLSKYFKTQRDARAWVKEMQTKINEGLTYLGMNVTLEEYLKEWLLTTKMTLRPKTFIQYTQIVNQHILPALGSRKLQDIRPDMIQTCYNHWIAQGMSARTVRLNHAVLHKALNHAMKLGMIGRNPTDLATKPRITKTEMKTFDDTQVRTFLLAAQGARLYALFNLALTTGLRQGELLGLKWSDIDWNTRKISIQRQVQRLRGQGVIFSEPKSSAGRRKIAIGKQTVEVLRTHYQQQQIEREFAGDRWVENDLVFPSTLGTPLDSRNLFRIFKEILQQTSLPNIRFHDLRHTAATLLLQQNVHPKVVQERLGHSDISLTLNTYSHVVPGMQEEAADKMDELLTMTDVSDALGNPPVRQESIKKTRV